MRAILLTADVATPDVNTEDYRLGRYLGPIDPRNGARLEAPTRGVPLPVWCIYEDDSEELSDTLPGDVANNSETALRIHRLIKRVHSDGINLGAKLGRNTTISQVHEILGIDKIATAIRAAGRGE